MLKRNHHCAELRENNVGEEVVLCGWVNRIRNLGGLIFVDLRDREGITQIVFHPSERVIFSTAVNIKNEYVIAVRGLVTLRPENMINLEMVTGKIELQAKELEILSLCRPLPFLPQEIEESKLAADELRLRYRYLDLRRPKIQKILFLRHKLAQGVRNFLSQAGFIEIETPMLTRSTPEGARDFLVPSRISKGSFYALPQSPQLFKQLLMVAGFDKYFQLAHCFRDEDFRADRQIEFTQVDVEMSFIEPKDIMCIMEEMFVSLMKEIMKIEISSPFPTLTWQEAMDRYGTDKPDLRYSLELLNLNHCFAHSKFRVFADAIAENGVIKGLKLSSEETLQKEIQFSRKQLDDLADVVSPFGAKGVLWYKVQKNESGSIILSSPTAKFLNELEQAALIKAFSAGINDYIFIIAGQSNIVNPSLDRLRQFFAKYFNLIPYQAWKFLWVTDFPMFAWDKEEQRFVAEHHPFTCPKLEQLDLLEQEPSKVMAQAYDLVLNGVELGGGSIRIHQREIQERVFKALNISEAEAFQKFGFLLEALSYGAPPHGGIALGFDRIVMLFSGEDSIRDTIAFPKTTKALCLMTKAPSAVEEKQLVELGLKIDQKNL